MPNRAPGNARSPRIQAPHHEGGRPTEELLREAHRLLDGAGIVMSRTKVARACRQFARRPHGSFRDFLSEAVRAEQGKTVAGLMAAAVPRHRAIREWDALGTREGSWPLTSGGASHG